MKIVPRWCTIIICMLYVWYYIENEQWNVTIYSLNQPQKIKLSDNFPSSFTTWLSMYVRTKQLYIRCSKNITTIHHIIPFRISHKRSDCVVVSSIHNNVKWKEVFTNRNNKFIIKFLCVRQALQSYHHIHPYNHPPITIYTHSRRIQKLKSSFALITK